MRADGREIACSIGRSGTISAADKREGDGATPIGSWPLRGVLLRPDRVMMPAGVSLPWRWIRSSDGWSDDPADPAYNQPIRHPHPRSAEHLWREDGLYDIVIILGHNDSPPVPGAGSAIFLHCWRDRATTEGCVAVAGDDLLALLPHFAPGDSLTIR
ncbi:L,D-transpeptidase [Sphingomonas sp. MMS24-J13]|uniref:L,D-transpeptidase family protein n=1 Tax=Sphingomonas sp. MMS24-J13 TaxID=3238686 RepID=UPI00384C9C9C